MAQPKVFVSHSHVDDAFAERLVADLCAAGADAWLDKEQLGAGDFQERISSALGECEWFLLVLTKCESWIRKVAEGDVIDGETEQRVQIPGFRLHLSSNRANFGLLVCLRPDG